MLMTKLKSKEEILSLTSGSVFVIHCHGCKEIGFPEAEAKELELALLDAGKLAGSITTDYVCNPNLLSLRLKSSLGVIADADAVLVLSCGVGVQTVAKALEDVKVFAGCDTIALPGFQGVTPLEHDCGQCGECFLNLTGGICPITACSKSLVNGPCGGTSRTGKCEVCADMDCGWVKIIQRLKDQGRLDVLKCKVQLHDFNTDEATKATKES